MDNGRKLSFLEISDRSFSEEKSIVSPMTELSHDLENSSMSTPRRKLSLIDVASPNKSSIASMESGIGSPLPELADLMDSPSIQQMANKKLAGCSNLHQRLMVSRSYLSPNEVRKPLEPLNFNTSFNNTSFNNTSFKPIDPIEMVEEKHSDLSLCEMSDEFPDLEDTNFEIKRRKGSMRSNSAPPASNSTEYGYSEDDGFFDEMSKDCMSCSPSMLPANFVGLMDAPFVNQSSPREDKENQALGAFKCEVQKFTFQKPVGVPLTKSRSLSFSVKRDNSTVCNSPVSRKKHKSWIGRSQSFYDTDQQLLPIEKRLKETPKRTLSRSQSFDTHSTKSPSIEITKLFDMDNKKLIGDKSREYCLPIVKSKHPDLKGITPETLADLIEGKYSDTIDEYHIIDCRYPYEYEGGKVKGALNIYEKSEILQKYLKNPQVKSGNNLILIFHCEFSSKRGPAMSRFLRNKDRDLHQQCYPRLYYPEMYLLEGGYKEFFAQKKECCEPQCYREMNDSKFSQELKKFSKRSKSCSDDNRLLRKRTGLRF